MTEWWQDVPAEESNQPKQWWEDVAAEEETIKTEKQFNPMSLSYEDVPEYERQIGEMAGYTPSEYEKLPESERKYKEKEANLTNQIKGFGKGLASGLTLTASEYLPETKITEEDSKIGVGLGELAGMVLPFKLIHGGISGAIKYFPRLEKMLKPVIGTTETFLTGAGHHAVSEAVGGKHGEPTVPNLKETVEHGATFAILHLAAKGGEKLVDKITKLNPKQQFDLLLKRKIPDDLPSQDFPEAEKTLDILKKADVEEINKLYETDLKNSEQEFQIKQKNLNDQFEQEHREKVAEIQKYNREKVAETDKQHIENVNAEFEKTRLKNESSEKKYQQELAEHQKEMEIIRSTHEAEMMDIQYENQRLIEAYEEGQVLPKDIGEIFSREPIHNTTEGGEKLFENVKSGDEIQYKKTNEAYELSDELYAEIPQTKQPQLVNDLMNTVQKINAIPEPSEPQKKLRKMVIGILDAITKREGNKVVSQEVGNQMLLEQAKSLRQQVDFDFEHGDSYNIFKPTINQLQDAAIRTAEQTGHTAAAQANKLARKEYAKWADIYNSPHIKPIRNRENRNFSDTYKKFLNFDEFNQLNRDILSQVPNGNTFSNQMKRDIVQKRLEPYFENPREHNLRKFHKELDELDAIISPSERKMIEARFNRSRQIQEKVSGKPPTLREIPHAVKIPLKPKPPEKLIPKEIKKPTPQQKELPLKEEPPIAEHEYPEHPITSADRVSGNFLNKKPEYIQKMMDTRSGIRELRDRLTQMGHQKQFEIQSKQKMRNILTDGKITKDFNGNDIARILENRKNYEIFSELIGESETKEMLEIAKLAGKKKMRDAAYLKTIKDVTKHAAIMKFITTISQVLI